MGIEAHLAASSRRLPSKTALMCGDVHLTYSQLDLRSSRFAARLLRAGVQKGDRVLLLIENGVEAVVALFGIWKAGAVACPLYPATKAEKLANILQSTQASVILTQERLYPVVEAAIARTTITPVIVVAQVQNPLPSGVHGFDDWITDDDSSYSSPSGQNACDPEALALIIHTSGSTGRPKGVMLTHRNLTFACESIVSYLGNTEDEIVLSVLPLSFGYGITQVATMAMAGGTLVLEKSFAFPRKILERLSETGATGFPLVPPMAALITGMKDLVPGFLPRLRYMTSAAAAMPPAIAERLSHLFPSTGLVLMYGQTECLRTTFLPPEEAARLPLSVGRAIPGTKAFVVDEGGSPVAPGVIGELVVEGPHVMAGYWRDDAATARSISEIGAVRRLKTGDLFRQDEEGYLYFISRQDDIIKTRGEKVSPQEVERALYALPGIREAAVGGVDDLVFGQIVRAYVVLEEGAALSEREIIRHCAGLLEDYMVPKGVQFMDALPRTTTGKIRLGAGDSNEQAQGNVA